MIETKAPGVNLGLLRDVPVCETNPFSPGFGCPPLTIAGRSDVINGFLSAVQNGPGSDGSTCIITGARGMGKTVLVNEIKSICRQAGFDVFSYSAGDNTHVLECFVDDLKSVLYDDEYDIELNPDISVFGVGGSIGSIKKRAHEISSVHVGKLLSAVSDKAERGVIIIVDEVDSRFKDDLVPIVKAYQSALEDKKRVFLIMSGLSAGIRRFEMLPGLTSIIRSNHVQLSALGYDDSMYLLIDTCDLQGGIGIERRNADIIARASCGYPFALQQFGSIAWDRAKRYGRSSIARSDCDIAVSCAYSVFATKVLNTIFRDMSNTELRIIREMALLADDSDNGIINISVLRKRLDFTSQYMGTYRNRMINDGLITTVGTHKQGEVKLSFPYMTDYVKNNIDMIDCAIATHKEHPLIDFDGDL